MFQSNIDWKWLRQGINEMLERGENDAGFILSANGETATGRVLNVRKKDVQILPRRRKSLLTMDPQA